MRFRGDYSIKLAVMSSSPRVKGNNPVTGLSKAPRSSILFQCRGRAPVPTTVPGCQCPRCLIPQTMVDAGENLRRLMAQTFCVWGAGGKLCVYTGGSCSPGRVIMNSIMRDHFKLPIIGNQLYRLYPATATFPTPSGIDVNPRRQ